MRKKIIIGNWKMYKNNQEAKKFLNVLNNLAKSIIFKNEVGIAVSYTNLSTVKNSLIPGMKLVAQNCATKIEGAFTGEVSIKMLEELNVNYVIIGHSERKQYFNESNEFINEKLLTIFNNSKITPILCCGERLEEYNQHLTLSIINNQITEALKNVKKDNVTELVIAYEPIWAIGSGKTASVAEAQTVCNAIRKIISQLYDQNTANEVRIQYGGSVRPNNIHDFLIQPDIDGALIGGASLIAEDFFSMLG